MGTLYELKCTGCGYQYEGAGGQEAGFLGVLETKSCGSCRRLVDVLAWSVEDPAVEVVATLRRPHRKGVLTPAFEDVCRRELVGPAIRTKTGSY